MNKKKKKKDSLTVFPRNGVHTATEAGLTSRFEWVWVEPGSYDRPRISGQAGFIKVLGKVKISPRVKC